MRDHMLSISTSSALSGFTCFTIADCVKCNCDIIKASAINAVQYGSVVEVLIDMVQGVDV